MLPHGYGMVSSEYSCDQGSETSVLGLGVPPLWPGIWDLSTGARGAHFPVKSGGNPQGLYYMNRSHASGHHNSIIISGGNREYGIFQLVDGCQILGTVTLIK